MNTALGMVFRLMTGSNFIQLASFSPQLPIISDADTHCDAKQGYFLSRTDVNLALLFQRQGDYENAKLMFGRTLEMYERELGSNHAYTACTLSCIGALLQSPGDSSQACPYIQRAIAIYTQSFGADHPTTQQYQQQLDSIDNHSNSTA